MRHSIRGFQIAIVLTLLLSGDAAAQRLTGGPAAYAAAFRELAAAGLTASPPGLLYSMVHASIEERRDVEALADTLVAVAIDLSPYFSGTDEDVARARATFRTIVLTLYGAGSWPADASRGVRFDGAGQRLISIAVNMPLASREPLDRAVPLRWFSTLPDSNRRTQELAELALQPYPLSAAAVEVLWSQFDGEGREIVADMYRRGAFTDDKTRSYAERLIWPHE